MKLRATLVAFIYLIGQQAAAVSLEQAVAQAIDTNPRITKQYARFQSAWRDSRGARGAFMPRVDLEAGAGYEYSEYSSGSLIDNGSSDAYRTSLTVSQLLFNGFKASAEAKRLSLEA